MNSWFDWPAKTAAQRFVAFDTVRSADVNDALDEVSAGFEKMPTPYKVNGGSANYAADTGTANTYAIALSSQITSYAAGLTVQFKATNSNTGASTLNVNALGAKSIVQPDGASALTTGMILAGQIVEASYDGTSFQLKRSSVAFTNDPGAIQNQTYVAFTTAGTSTAYTLTPVPAITAYAAGQSFFVNFNAASGAAPTLAISGLASPPNLVKQLGDGTYSNIAANDIPINHRSRVTLLSATQALVEKLPIGFLASGSQAVTQATNDTSTKIATTAFANPAASLAESGYVKLPSGLILQWGSSVITLNASGDGTITFPLAFPTAVYTVCMSSGDVSVSGSGVFAMNGSSITVFNLSVRPNPGAINVRVNWTATGT